MSYSSSATSDIPLCGALRLSSGHHSTFSTMTLSPLRWRRPFLRPPRRFANMAAEARRSGTASLPSIAHPSSSHSQFSGVQGQRPPHQRPPHVGTLCSPGKIRGGCVCALSGQMSPLRCGGFISADTDPLPVRAARQANRVVTSCSFYFGVGVHGGRTAAQARAWLGRAVEGPSRERGSAPSHVAASNGSRKPRGAEPRG